MAKGVTRGDRVLGTAWQEGAGFAAPVLTFALPARTEKKGRWFIATCDALDVCSQGETKEKALHNLADALNEFFVSCFERGTLNAVLRDAGFIPSHPRPGSSATRVWKGEVETLKVSVPFVIQDRSGDEPEAHPE